MQNGSRVALTVRQPQLSVLVWLTTILIVAAVMRIHGVSQRPVWTDEGWTTWAISDPTPASILAKVSTDTHPPLYFLSLGLWSQIAGDSHLALRLLSIFGGLLTVAIVYRMGADIFSRHTGILAALFMALLPLPVYYSQEIRHYGFLILACTLGTWLFLRYLRRPSWGTLIAYGSAVAFMLYSMYLSALMLVVHGIIGLIVWRTAWMNKGRLFLVWIGAGLAFVPWIVVLIGQTGFLLGTVAALSGFPTNLGGLFGVGMLFAGGQLALLGGLYLLGAWHVLASARRQLDQITVVLCGIGVLALMTVFNLKVGALLPRYLVYLTPYFVLIAAWGLTTLARRAQWVLALSAVIVYLGGSDAIAAIQPRLNSGDAARVLAAQYSPGDLVALETGWDDNAFRYEVLQALPKAEVIRTLPWVDNRKQDTPVLPQLTPQLQAARRVWVLNWFQPSQIIPALARGDLGYERAIINEVPVIGPYLDLYKAPVMRVVLFERVNLGASKFIFSGMFALHDAIFSPEVRRGQPLHIDLWWSALKPPPLDYSAGVFIRPISGAVATNQDAALAGKQTSQWQINQPAFDRHTLNLPDSLPAGQYEIAVQVYWYGDQKPLPVGGGSGSFAIIGQVTIR